MAGDMILILVLVAIGLALGANGVDLAASKKVTVNVPHRL